MNYIVDYSVASLLYLGVILWFYLRQKRVPNLRSQIFKGMLLVGVTTVFWDIITVLMDQNAAIFPIWLLWLVNFVFILIVQTSPLLLFVYTVVLTNHWHQKTRAKTILTLLPLLGSAGLLCLSAFGRFGAFYIDGNHRYHQGATHPLLYVVAAGYIFSSAVLVFRGRKDVQKNKQRVIYAFITITAAAMLVQRLYPQYLVNASANALALLMIYCALELPSDHIDPLTGAFNRGAAIILLEDLYLRHQPFSIQVVSMKSFKTVNQQFGNKIGDVIFRRIYEYLRAAYPACKIFRCHGDVFGVIRVNETMDEASLGEAVQRFPAVWDTGEAHVCTSIKMAGIDSRHCVNAAAVFATLDYIMEEFHQTDSKDVLLADHGFYNRCLEKSELEHALDRAIANNSVELCYQPIHRNPREVESLEALARVYDETLGVVSPEVFSRIAEQNGTILKLGEQVLHKVCQFMRDSDLTAKGIRYVSINLSVVQCMKENLSRDFLEITRQYGVDPGQICFEITETSSVDSFELVRKTMGELSRHGFRFSLDDFGTGYANFRYLTELPFANVKLDKSLLWSAMRHQKQKKLLAGITGILHNMDLRIVCEGVETKEQVALLDALGVEMHQGFYYSKALPQAELLHYLDGLPARVHTA
ncbi:MAG: EAL domain-containing protein [Oscillibacter sp.]